MLAALTAGVPLVYAGSKATKALFPGVNSPDYGETQADINAKKSLDEAEGYQGEMAGKAREYQRNLPGTQLGLENQAADVGRRSLAGNLTDVRRNASSRGLLYSGLRQGGEANAYGGYLSGLSQARAGINESTQSNADQMTNQAKEQGLNIQSSRQALNDALYNRRMQAYNQAQAANQQRTETVGGLLGGIGSLAGMGAARA